MWFLLLSILTLKLNLMGKVILMYLDLHYIDNEVKTVFIPKSMTSLRSAGKLSSY